jgi:AcrR family transcriptional regulator
VFDVPRIRAATVVEHREMQRTALLDAARELMSAGGTTALTFPALAERTGLARSSIYEYFGSRSAVIEALVTCDLPAATNRLRAAMAAEPTPERQLATFVRRQIRMAADPWHRMLLDVVGMDFDRATRERLRSAQWQISELAAGVLRRMGHPDPRTGALLLQGVVDAATRLVGCGTDPQAVSEAAVNAALIGALGPVRRRR